MLLSITDEIWLQGHPPLGMCSIWTPVYGYSKLFIGGSNFFAHSEFIGMTQKYCGYWVGVGD